MACPRIDHSLFQKMRLEHQKILVALEAWSSLTGDDRRYEQITWLWDFVELRHHAQEEELVFNAIYNHPKIHEGGPLCTLYFDFHMADNPLQQAQKITGQIPLVDTRQEKFYEVRSPVRIPVDEHRGGKEVLRFLLSEWPRLSTAERANCLNTYKRIQTQHILKEESCFFHLCSRLFTEEQLNLLSDRWQAA